MSSVSGSIKSGTLKCRKGLNKIECEINMKTVDADQNTTQTNVEFVYQRTIKEIAICEGVGLHSGEAATITLLPSPAGSGIVFERSDVEPEKSLIPARWDNVVDTRLCTVIGNDHGVCISTIEHLMAALSGCGVDNVKIEIDGPEVPIMDGSSGPFVKLIEKAGLVEQDKPRRVIRVLKPVEVQVGEARAALAPADSCSLDVGIDFEGTAVNKQSFAMGFVNGAFCKELAEARTFGFLHEVEAMQAAGLGKGGSLDNAIIVDGSKIMNEGGLRYDDEFVRHKILDAVGDLYLAGALIVGSFAGARSGHAINNKLLHALFEDDDAWCYEEISGNDMKNAVDGGIWAEPSVGPAAIS
jgi:UDP-3-O-[3-hydroxymyristoyl] N-acetylglucosamine deacetylase